MLIIIKQQKLPTELIVDILNTINTDEGDLIKHHNIEITEILREPFKLWNKYTTNVLTSSSITCRFSGELFKKRKQFYVMSVEQLNHQLSLAHARITSQDRQIASQDQQIASQDQQIASQQTQLNKLTGMIGLPPVFVGYCGRFERRSCSLYALGFTGTVPFNKVTSRSISINYFEITFSSLEGFDLLGLCNDKNFIFINSQWELKSDPGRKLLLDVDEIGGPITIGSGIVWPSMNKFYKSEVPHIFFTINGQKIGKYIPVDSSSDMFHPKFDCHGDDAVVNVSLAEGFRYDVVNQDFGDDVYNEEDWDI
uniref:Uncharacterized protein n=1 Tax=Meloidogyne enterolobii TaxID=390850 RepID=A0A6V7XRE0_MELEN|nr:unnamed protein product [Meloidogyne enterolobii]